MDKNLKICFVYAYLDPRKPGNYSYDEYNFKFEPIYIGKGSSRKQLYRHLNEAKNNFINNPIKFHKIKHILNIGLNPIILKLKENLTEIDAYELEKKLVALIGRLKNKTGPLSNLKEGGQGAEINPPIELRKLFGCGTKGKTYEQIYGEQKAKELKQKRIESNKNRQIRKNTNISKPEIELQLTFEQIIKYNTNISHPNPKIYKLTNPNNEFILTKNLKQTCKDFGLHPGYTLGLISGKTKYHKGWKCELYSNQ